MSPRLGQHRIGVGRRGQWWTVPGTVVALVVALLAVPRWAPARADTAATVQPMYTWGGDNRDGELADGTTTAHTTPEAVMLARDASAVAVDAGGQFGLAIGSDGNLYAWGSDNYGQLGIGGNVDPPFYFATPQRVTLADGVRPTAVSAGFVHSLAIGSDGNLYGWGDNEVGELGTGNYGHQQYSPVRVPLPDGVHPTAIAAGNGGTSLMIGSDGNLYGWGWNSDGEIAGSTAVQVHSPVRVSLPVSVHATAIAAGANFVLMIGSDGNLYAWGSDYYGQLGVGNSGDNEPSRVPTRVTLAAGVRPVAISAGIGFALATGSDGNLYAWGLNALGQLGDGSTTNRSSPVRVSLPTGVDPVTIAADSSSTMIGSDGNLYVWGPNLSGQLGDGTYTSRNTPEREALPGGVTPVAIAPGHTFAVALTQLAPRFVTASPPARATVGASVDYTFAATGLPTPTYALSGAPSWLSIDLDRGELSGTVPEGASTITYSVTATSSAGSTTAGPFTLAISAAAADISGTVVAQAGTPVAGALVEACSTNVPSGSVCGTATTDAAGAFTTTAGIGDTISVTAYPPPAARLLPATSPATLVPAAGLSGQRLVLPVPISTGLGGLNFTSGQVPGTWLGMPMLYWLAWPQMTLSGCSDGVALASVVGSVPGRSADFGHWEYRVSTLTEQPAGSGSYAGALDPLFPMHGPADLTDSVACLPHQIMSPSTGPAGTTVRAMATGLVGVTGVRFGAMQAASFTDLGHGMLQAIAPPGSGTVPITAETSAGAVALGSYTYQSGTAATTASSFTHPRLAATARLSPAISVSSILEWLYSKGPGALSNLLNLKSAITAGVNDFHPTCKSTAAAVASAISAAIGPLVDAAVDAALPGIEELELGAFLETGPALLVLLALTPIAVHYVAGKIVGALVNAAVEAAFNALDCKDRTPKTDVLIDPSGTVLDTNGNPVSGATATILRADTAGGPFVPVDVTEPGIRPAVNPETTGSGGVFHWDVRSGYYEVQASKPSCTDAADASTATATIGPYPVPPPQVGLTITLACPDEPAPPVPAVGQLSVSNGPAAGGTPVLIIGSGFTPAATVTFGKAAAAVTYLSPNALSVTTPAGRAGVDVVVHTKGGDSATTDAGRFFYGSPPTVTGLDVDHGPATGGTKVTLTGTGFTGATVVGFGGAPGTELTVLSDTKLQVSTPARLPGTVPVEVVTPAGASTGDAAGQFTFLAKVPVTLGVTSSPEAPVYGQDVTLTVTTKPARRGAVLTVSEAGSRLGSATAGLDGTARAVLPGLRAGAHDLTVSYPGNADTLPATATTRVTVARAATRLSIDPVVSAGPFENLAQLLDYVHRLVAYLRHPTVTAHLTVAYDGNPVSGAKIRIETSDGLICAGTTDDTGTVTCEVPRRMQLLVLRGKVHASYAGSADYLPASSGSDQSPPGRGR